mgnify:CR=1 FL=1
MPDEQIGHAQLVNGHFRGGAHLCARLDAAGWAIERPRNQLHFAELGRDVVTIFYRDPDGNVVELLEWQG